MPCRHSQTVKERVTDREGQVLHHLATGLRNNLGSIYTNSRRATARKPSSAPDMTSNRSPTSSTAPCKPSAVSVTDGSLRSHVSVQRMLVKMLPSLYFW
ncbi:hypothetical protein [Streptomyces sp. NBC_00140]|uniref:hypothetical protein n=1 Tax=Streptomyces sp. NBC_00140 TaxID=2975664 RepID=UPI002250CC6D|nr:hypothetical protein [Streptomyces sp. NBC_00140]MCX5336436.1 hypothetical protein [Streptomyces sp. NBC_00140]